MGFNAETAVSKLDWDFTTFVPDAKGVTPEPSVDQAEAFLSAMRDLAAEADADDDTGEGDRPVLSDQEALAKFEGMSSEKMRALSEKLIGAFADVCSNNPTREQITALPYRQQQAFFGYIYGQILNPQ